MLVKIFGLFEQLDLQIKAGEKVGLVGRSGSGKTTLVNLLLRFYDVERGKITIDAQDITQVQQKSVRAAIGVVSQDTSLSCIARYVITYCMDDQMRLKKQ